MVSLTVNPHRGDNKDGTDTITLVVFSHAVVGRLAEQYRRLERIEMTIPRTRSNERETAIYRALGRLPLLRRAFLRL